MENRITSVTMKHGLYLDKLINIIESANISKTWIKV